MNKVSCPPSDDVCQRTASLERINQSTEGNKKYSREARARITSKVEFTNWLATLLVSFIAGVIFLHTKIGTLAS